MRCFEPFSCAGHCNVTAQTAIVKTRVQSKPGKRDSPGTN